MFQATGSLAARRFELTVSQQSTSMEVTFERHKNQDYFPTNCLIGSMKSIWQKEKRKKSNVDNTKKIKYKIVPSWDIIILGSSSYIWRWSQVLSPLQHIKKMQTLSRANIPWLTVACCNLQLHQQPTTSNGSPVWKNSLFWKWNIYRTLSFSKY